jgi:hypothetical protein
MNYYVIKDNKTINSFIWDNFTDYKYPFECDLIIGEDEWNSELYPFLHPIITEPIINMNNFAETFSNFVAVKENTTPSELLEAFQNYLDSMIQKL